MTTESEMMLALLMLWSFGVMCGVFFTMFVASLFMEDPYESVDRRWG